MFSNKNVAALAAALDRGDFATADGFLRAGTNVNSPGQCGVTLLKWAMNEENKGAFKWLLDNGADPNLAPSEGYGALSSASSSNDQYWLEMLLARKPNVDLKQTFDDGNDVTPMFAAIVSEKEKNLSLLISAGADVNGRINTWFGNKSLLDWAAENGWFRGLYMLLEAGAEWHHPTESRGLPFVVLRWKLREGSNAEWRDRVLTFFREHGADVDAAQKIVNEEKDQDRPSR